MLAQLRPELRGKSLSYTPSPGSQKDGAEDEGEARFSLPNIDGTHMTQVRNNLAAAALAILSLSGCARPSLVEVR